MKNSCLKTKRKASNEKDYSHEESKALIQRIKKGEKEDMSSLSTYNPHEEW